MCLFCWKRDRKRRREKPVVALLFGSFNPIHEGHLAILRYLTENTKADEVRLVVSPQSPFKQGQGLVDNAAERLAGARQAVAEAGLPVAVSDVEFHLPEPWYTIDTLRFLEDQGSGRWNSTSETATGSPASATA